MNKYLETFFSKKDWTQLMIGICLLVIIPYIPTNILLLTDNIFIRILAVFILLYFVNIHPVSGIFAFVIICALYIERNRRKIARAQQKILTDTDSESKYMSVKDAGKPQQTVPVLPFADADDALVHFTPYGETGTNDFQQIDDSINHKKILPTSALGQISGSFFEKIGVASTKLL
jgi:hypothetical protein